MYIQPLFAISEISELQQAMHELSACDIDCGRCRRGGDQSAATAVGEGGFVGTAHRTREQESYLYSKGRSIKTVTAIFQSPNAYISPKWYVNGQRSGRNAPSWNYMAVQAQGRIRFIDDALWMREHLDALTHSQEELREEPWSPTQADPEFLGLWRRGSSASRWT
jgi:transcriptional regulator